MAEHPVETILQYRFSNRDLLNEALLAAGASASSNHIQGEKQGNKRLALLGDAVLDEIVLEPWYDSGQSTEVGHNKIKNLCNNKKLSKIAREIDLVKHVTENPCQQGEVPQETAAATVEAVVGAVYLDCGKDAEIVKSVLTDMNFYSKE